MGSSPYWYFVDYEDDFNSALQKLREREFKAGRYNPVIPMPEFPINENLLSPGAQHESIEEALDDAMEDGTRSILDLALVGSEDDFCVARVLESEELLELFGTDKPTQEMIENHEDLFEIVDRGRGICVPVYQNNVPVKLFFMGYSFD
jgi:hypothetical protein